MPVSARSARARLFCDGSGDVRDGVVSEWDGGIGGPGWVVARVLEVFGTGVPETQVLEDFADDRKLVDDGDDAHRIPAFGANKGVDFVSVFKQMGQMFGLAKGVFCSSFSC